MHNLLSCNLNAQMWVTGNNFKNGFKRPAIVIKHTLWFLIKSSTKSAFVNPIVSKVDRDSG